MSTRVLFVLLVLAHLIWGGAFIVLKIVLASLTVSQVLLGRVLLAALIYAVLWPRIPKPDYRRGDWKYLGLLALCEPFLLFTFETLGLRYTTASQAGMIVACVPLTVAVGAYFLYRETVRRRSMAGIALAVLGVVIVSAFGGEVSGAPNPLLGNFFMACAVLSGTCYALTVKHLAARYSFLFLSAVQVFGATLLFLPGALMDPLPASLSWEVLGGIAYLGIGLTFCVYFLINYALTRVKAAHVILFSNLIPVFTLLLAFFILDERLNAIQYAGAALVMGGVLLAGAPEETAASDEDRAPEVEAQAVSGV